MHRVLLALALLVPLVPARAAILFTPHLSEYAKQARGAYADHTLTLTRIEDAYDSDGNKRPIGVASAPDESIDAALLLLRYLWVGNLFENTGVPFLRHHDQLFRVIGNLGWQQASAGLADNSRTFGQRSGGSGLGDLYLLAGVYGAEYRWGPLKANDLWTFTYKWPVGDYDTRALLNTGTHYPSYIPQFAHHQEWFGRLFVDATAAYQFNGRNDTPAYGGLTPTEPADVYNLEANFAWKFSERWYGEFGVSHRKSVGPNRYRDPDINFVDPVPPTTACNLLNIGPDQCSLVSNFRLRPVPGVYEDEGIEATLLGIGAYYVYRSSSVVSLRLMQPVAGRGGQIDLRYDVNLDTPAGPLPIPLGQQEARLNGVQEAASVSASPYLEARFVYLFWAP